MKSSIINSSRLCLIIFMMCMVYAQNVEYKVYNNLFRLRDGSKLTEDNSVAVNSLIQDVRRLLSINYDENIVNFTRALDDDKLIKVLFLAVAGNMLVYNPESTHFQQRCLLVADPGTGSLMFEDTSNTKILILEVLIIISILCLLRAWSA